MAIATVNQLRALFSFVLAACIVSSQTSPTWAIRPNTVTMGRTPRVAVSKPSVPLPPPDTGPLYSIMMVGDSLTSGLVGVPGTPDRMTYRPYLWEMIQANPAVASDEIQVDFVGFNRWSGMGGLTGAGRNPVLHESNSLYMPNFDDDNSARRGYATYRFDTALLASYAPDAALILLGTNDVITSELFGTAAGYNAAAAETTRASLTKMVRDFQQANPYVSVLLGTVPPQYWYIDPDQVEVELGGYEGPDAVEFDDDGDGAWLPRFDGDEIELVNSIIRALGSGGSSDLSTANSQVIVIDHYDGFHGNPADPNTYSLDGVHPNVVGDQFLAQNWYAPLSGFLADRAAVVAALSPAAAAVTAVPEPSAFLLVGVLAMLYAWRSKPRVASS